MSEYPAYESRSDRELLEDMEKLLRSMALRGAKTIDELQAAIAFLDCDVSILNLSTRSNETLTAANISSVRDLVKLRSSELHSVVGLGRKGINEVVEALSDRGLRLRQPSRAVVFSGVD